MTTPAAGAKQRFIEKYLDPGARISEVLFGLIMVLTFTLTAGLSVSEGAEGVRELLVAAIGCNIAWGIIDGVFYVMGALFERGRRRLYREIVQVVQRTEPPKNGIRRDDLYGALASFWLVFFSALPAVVPFLIFRDQPRFALRVSNGLLLGMLFIVGYRWARFTGGPRVMTGAVLTLVGGVLVAIAIALGG